MRVQNFEQFSIKECSTIANMDGGAEFSALNSFNYYVCINTWVNLCYSYNEVFAHTLACYIHRDGLLTTISRSSESADMFIQSDCQDKDDLAISLTAGLGIRDTLQILRYAKRFTVIDSKLEAKCFDDFISFNNQLKLRERKELPYWLTSLVKKETTRILRTYHKWTEVDGSFSNGACVEAKTLAEKLSTWGDPCFLDPMYPIQGDGLWDFPVDYSECVAVPKNSEKYRIIAKENSFRQFRMSAMRKSLLKASAGKCNINFTAQEQNQVACYLGATKMSDYATIDLSHASDSITMSHVYTMLPDEVARDVNALRSTRIKVKGKERTSYIALTSGTNITFPIETYIFWGIATAATKYVKAMCKGSYVDPIVYGDDILCDIAVYDTLCDWLELLHFEVNLSKSFCTTSYRESCGVEMWNDEEVDINYYPRKPITKSPNSVAALCQLQHRMYPYYKVQRFLCVCVRNFLPNMTSHLPLTDCEDLWEPVPEFRKWTCPMVKGTELQDETWAQREGHFALSRLRPTKDLNVCNTPQANLDMYYYVQYLLNGPMYEDPLLELLGVSTSRSDYWRDSTAPDMIWKLQME